MAKAKTIPELRAMILASGNKMFTVKFLKREDGSERTMVARLKVTKHLKGGEKAYDDTEHALLTVYDTQKAGYRAVDLSSVFYFKCGDVEYVKPVAKKATKKASR